MKQINGCWLPDAENTAWLEKVQTRWKGFDFPAYQADRIRACLDALQAYRPGSRRTFVDGGAHVGLWTVPLVRRGFQTVHAFEPIAELADCLAQNVHSHTGEDRAGTVWIHRLAIGGSSEDLHLVGSPSKSVTWSVSSDPALGPKLQQRAAKQIKLDTLKLTDVDLIKLDVEGFEYRAIAGALDTIALCRPVIMIEEKHDPVRAASQLLGDLGYRLAWQKKHDLLWVPK